MARERTPYFKRYPKIVRAKRIVLPIAIGVMLVCLVTAINNPGSFWWLGPNNDDDDLNRYLR